MGEEVQEHLRLALRRMLKPLIRLLISQGVSHADFSEAAKDVYVEIAVRHFSDGNKINRSRIAILTGLTRKEVKNVLDRALAAEGHGRLFSRPSRVLTGWYSDPAYTGPYGIPLDLPYETQEPSGVSFVNLVRIYSGDMAPRQMLTELMRSGSVIEVDGRYKAVRRNYEPQPLSPELINRLGDLGYRVFSTAARNIDKEYLGGGYFDRHVFADNGCTDEVIERFDKYIKARGQELLEEIDVWFSTNEKANAPGATRKGTGLYMVHYVENPDEKSTLTDLLLEKGVEKNNGNSSSDS